MANPDEISVTEGRMAEVADLLRAHKDLPYGQLYSYVMDGMTPMEFDGMMDILVRSGLAVRFNRNAVWVEPKGN